MTSHRYARPAALVPLSHERNAVIEASAGTGKTFTLEHLVVDLLLAGVPIEEILVVTFTEKATREMRERVRVKIAAILDPRPSDPQLDPKGGPAWTIDDRAKAHLAAALAGFDRAAISTIHAFCQRALVEHAFEGRRLFEQEQVSAPEAFGHALRQELRVVLASSDPLRAEVERALAAWLDEAELVKTLLRWYSERGVPDVSGALGRTDEGNAGRASALAPLVRDLLPRIHQRLAADKERRGHFDFDDMLLVLRDRLVGEGGDGLVAQLRARYRYALVDEFQDTDEVQWSIFRRVFFEAGRGHALYVIGDPKQAIYSFRNADRHTYEVAKREILAAGGDSVALLDNQRSTPPLVDAYNAIIEGIFAESGEAYAHVRAARTDLELVDARGRAVPPVTLGRLVADKPSADEIRPALGAWVAREIGRMMSEGWQLRDARGARTLGYEDVYVLTRSSAEAQAMGVALRSAGIPFAFFRQDGLMQTVEATHVRALLCAIESPSDPARRFSAWLTPFFGVPLGELQKYRDVPASHPLVELFFRWRSTAATGDFARFFDEILHDSGLVRRELLCAATDRALTNYLHVFEMLLERAYESRAQIGDLVATIDDWIAERTLQKESDKNVMRLESDRRAVQVLTVHVAKGLEAPVVFLAGGFTRGPTREEPRVFHRDGKRFAWLGSEGPDEIKTEERQEETRLMYVALTRAKAKLFLPYFGVPDAMPKKRGAGLPKSFTYLASFYRRLDDVLTPLTPRFEMTTFDLQTRASIAPPAVAPAAQAVDAALVEGAVDDVPRFADLRSARKGFVITSYTRLARRTNAPDVEDDASEKDVHVPLAEVARELAATTGLPPGAATGVFLHEVLEELSFEDLRHAQSFEAWASPQIAALFLAKAERNGVAALHSRPAMKLIFDSLKSPVALGEDVLAEGLCAVANRASELPLLYPLPSLPDAKSPGFVRAIVDLVFEHEGRTYFLDWKSDLLASYEQSALEAHVRAHYGLQLKLYTLGIARMLDATHEAAYDLRFGGVLYCFLRGMGRDNVAPSGVYFRRPKFGEVSAWQDELVELSRAVDAEARARWSHL